MAHKTFISYKYSEAQNVRDTILDALGDDAVYYQGETADSPDLTDDATSTIRAKLTDMMYGTSVTIVVLSPQIKKSNWIDWEIAILPKGKSPANYPNFQRPTPSRVSFQRVGGSSDLVVPTTLRTTAVPCVPLTTASSTRSSMKTGSTCGTNPTIVHVARHTMLYPPPTCPSSTRRFSSETQSATSTTRSTRPRTRVTLT